MVIRCLDLISVLPDEEVQKGIGDPQAVRIDVALRLSLPRYK
jgi:hypothetical protein